MRARPLLLLGVLAACGGDIGPASSDGQLPGGDAGDADGAVPTGPDGGPRPDAAPPDPEGVRARARALAAHLSGQGRFLIGVGNDYSGPFDRDVPIDLHYMYLVGYGDRGGWPTWNPDGAYIDYLAAQAAEHDVAPMFTYYQLALELEQGNDGVFVDEERMRQYLLDVRLLYERLAATGAPAVVTFEPDLFGYLMQRTADSGIAPADVPARLRYADVHDCDAQPETVAGLTRCLVDMARAIAPEVRVGFHASMWGAWYDVTSPTADVEGSGRAVGAFLADLGARDTDFVAIETSDRDAGFWETSGGGPTCSIDGGSRGAVYWDEDNATLPSFHDHLRWVGALTGELERPALWWQTPLGVPSDTCGGSDEHWRDNRVRYFFTHVDELVDAGGVGVTFGTGAGGQTHLGTDGDQLRDAAVAYRAAPFAL